MKEIGTDQWKQQKMSSVWEDLEGSHEVSYNYIARHHRQVDKQHSFNSY